MCIRDSDFSGFFSWVNFTLPTWTNVTVEKNANTTTTANGFQYHYYIYFNVTGGSASWLNITDTLDANLGYVSDNSGSLGITLGGSSTVVPDLWWNFTSIPVGDYMLDITVQYNGPNDGRVIVNNATGEWLNQTNVDSNTSADNYVNVIPAFSEAIVPVASSLIMFALIGCGKKSSKKRRK